MSTIQTFDFSANLLRALLWRNNEAPNLQALLQFKQDYFDSENEQFWSDWARDVFDLRTANEFGLNVWSIILGINITIEPVIPPVLNGNFGFGEFRLNFGTPIGALDVWTSQTSSADDTWEDIAFGDGVFIAVARSGAGTFLMRSANNGVTWADITQPLGGGTGLRGVAFGNGVFVVVKISQGMISTDGGLTWDVVDVSAAATWGAVAFGNDTFVAISEGGIFPASVRSVDDGATWEHTGDLPANAYTSVAFGNGVFVTTGTGAPSFYTSTDGLTWTPRTTSDGRGYSSAAYGDGVFVAVSSTGDINRVQRSVDNGATWTVIAAASAEDWTDVAFGGGAFVAVTDTGVGDRSMISTDGGLTWDLLTTPADNDWQALAYGDNSFVAISNTGTNDRAMSADRDPNPSNFAPSPGGFSLGLEDARIVLRLRYYQLTTNGNVTDINLILADVFGGLGLVYVLDNLDMTMGYNFLFDINETLLNVLEGFDILPRPAGVEVNLTVNFANSNFGFGVFRKNFNNGNFSPF